MSGLRIMRMVVSAAVVLTVGVAVGQAPVGGKRVMTFADLMGMKRVSDPQVSASGRWVLFSVTEVDLEKNVKVNHLWVVPVGGGGDTTAGPSTAAGARSAPGSAQDDNPKGGIAGEDDNLRERQVTFEGGETFGRFSPDGRWVSYSMGGQIYLAAWDEAAGTVGVGKKLTDVSGGGDGAVWAPDSKRLMFVGEVWPGCSVKGGGRAVVDPTLRDGAAKDGAPGVFVVGGTRDGVAWKGAEAAKWGEEDACDRARDEETEKSAVKGEVWEGLLYRHWDQYTGEKRSHVLVVNVDGAGWSKSNNAVRDLTPAGVVGDAEVPTFSLGGPLGYAWAPDSKEVAYVANLDAVPAASTNNDVFTLRLDEVGAKAVRVSTSLGSDDGPAYSPDGKWLAFRSQARAGFESDKFDLVAMDRSTGAIRNLTKSWTNWVDEFLWTPKSDGFLFAFPSEGEESIATLPLHPEGDDRGRGVLMHRGELGSLAISKDVLVGTRMTVESPPQLFEYDPMHLDNETSRNNEWGGEVVLTHVNDALLSQLDLPKMESFWFVGAEGTKVEGFILRPPGFVEGKKYPVKFIMHGGPQTALGDSWSYRWNWELMAASGYVVVGINRRGSTGYGQRFIDEVSGDWGGRAYEDLMKGLDYAEAHFPFMDKTRECALGASYGGFMADWVLTHTDRFKCIVTHDGMVDPVGAYGSTEELWFNEWEFRRPEDFPKGWDGFLGVAKKRKTNTEIPGLARNDASMGMKGLGNVGADGHAAEPWRYASLPAEEDPFRRWSPMRFIERAKTPTLVIHSQKDYRLDVSQGLELFTALQRLGVPSKMLYFPDEGHWVLKPQNSQLWYEEVGDWCDQWTKTGKYAER